MLRGEFFDRISIIHVPEREDRYTALARELGHQDGGRSTKRGARAQCSWGAVRACHPSLGACGRDQLFCEACCKANMSCFNSATMFCSLRLSACKNASRLITLPPGLPWLCSGNRDFAFGVFNERGKLIAVLSLSCIQANCGVQQAWPDVNNRAVFLV
jgi:hypothetical protein